MTGNASLTTRQHSCRRAVSGLRCPLGKKTGTRHRRWPRAHHHQAASVLDPRSVTLHDGWMKQVRIHMIEGTVHRLDLLASLLHRFYTRKMAKIIVQFAARPISHPPAQTRPATKRGRSDERLAGPPPTNTVRTAVLQWRR